MNTHQYQNKMAIYFLLVSGATLFSGNSFATSVPAKNHPATPIERVASAAKHKALSEKSKPIMNEAVEIESDTQKAIVALQHKDKVLRHMFVGSTPLKFQSHRHRRPVFRLNHFPT